MKVLVVDDVLTNTLLKKTYLSSLGEIDTAQDGRTAITLFQEALTKGEPYDLVCLDIMMPVFNGHRTLKEMRRIEKEHQVPDKKHSIIIMVTALANQQTVVEALEKGCDSYIAKPVRKDVLMERLKQFHFIEA